MRVFPTVAPRGWLLDSWLCDRCRHGGTSLLILDCGVALGSSCLHLAIRFLQDRPWSALARLFLKGRGRTSRFLNTSNYCLLLLVLVFKVFATNLSHLTYLRIGPTTSKSTLIHLLGCVSSLTLATLAILDGLSSIQLVLKHLDLIIAHHEHRLVLLRLVDFLFIPFFC